MFRFAELRLLTKEFQVVTINSKGIEVTSFENEICFEAVHSGALHSDMFLLLTYANKTEICTRISF